MSSSSSASRVALRREVDARIGACSLAVAGELLAIGALLGTEKSLRTSLADPGTPVGARQALAADVFAGKVQSTTAELLAAAVANRWPDAMDLVEVVEELGAVVAFTAAEADGSLDAVEEEIFLFGRAVEANPELQMTLTNPAVGSAQKAALVRDLLGSATATATELLAHVAANLRGRRVDSAVSALSNLAAAQRERVVAQVRVAVALDDAQTERLAGALSRFAARQVHLNVVVDPTVIGGASVRLGDQVIDGTMLTRLSQARRSIVG